MALRAADDTESRFMAYVAELTSLIGHADRVGPRRDCRTGLVMPSSATPTAGHSPTDGQSRILPHRC
jgi:hypothetical protein